MASSVGHQSPASTLPPFAYKTPNTQVWLTTGNTDVVADPYVHTNSMILINNTSAISGTNWVITVATGSFTVTSTDSESAGVTYSYIVL